MNWKAIPLLISLVLAAGTGTSWAEKLTPAGLAQQREIVNLSGKATFREAIRVIESISGEKVVFPADYADADKEIGFDLPGIQWRIALNIIAKDRGLDVSSRDGMVELKRKILEGGKEKGPESEILIDSREVSISAVFFEMNRTALREIGIDWASLRGGGVSFSYHDTLGFKNGRIKSIGAGGTSATTVEVLTLLRMFESKGQGEIIANPQIKVLSGKEGNVRVGTDFFVSTRDFAGNTVQQLQSVGTILTVTPRVITQDGTNFIYLLINAERSSYDPGTGTIGKTTASTYALLYDGEETAMGGLYGTAETAKREGLPFLKDLPWWFFGLRYVFGYDRKEVTRNELVVLVKADIVPTLKSRIEDKEKQKTTREKVQERNDEFEQRMRKK